MLAYPKGMDNKALAATQFFAPRRGAVLYKIMKRGYSARQPVPWGVRCLQ